MKKWLFFIMAFIATIVVLVLMTNPTYWFKQPNPQKVTPQQSPKILETTLQRVKGNLVSYRINKLSYEVKKDYGWRRDYVADQLSKMNLTKWQNKSNNTEFYDVWIKIGSEGEDQKFVIYCQGWDDESNVCFLTLAQKISELNTKKSYTFIIQRDVRLREPAILVANILKNELHYAWENRYVLRRLNLALVNQDFDSHPEPNRFLYITPKGDLSDEPNTILKMCNFNLHIISLYEDDYFNFHSLYEDDNFKSR